MKKKRSPRQTAKGIPRWKKSTCLSSRNRRPFAIEKSPLEQAKDVFDIPRLWDALRLPGQPATSCKSPFRDDRKPSFSVSEDGKLWHDFATDEAGDVVAFLAKATGTDLSEAGKELIRMNGKGGVMLSLAMPSIRPEKEHKPSLLLSLPYDLRMGTEREIRALSALRGMHPDGLALASAGGGLRFATVKGQQAWLVVSSCGRNAQARRLDGQPWLCGSKAYTFPHAQASIPIGWERIEQCPFVALVEGAPDLLACYCLLYAEGRSDVAPVAMLGASCRIPENALSLFRGKIVRIFQHADDAGEDAAQRWAAQLRQARASRIDAVCFPQHWQTTQGGRVKDLADFLHLEPDLWESLANRNVLPCTNH